MIPASILKQAINDGAFNGDEPITFGRLAISTHRNCSIVAIANPGGWWTMYADEIEAIAAAVKGREMSAAERAEMEAVTELQIAQLIEQRDALLAACKSLLRFHDTGNYDECDPAEQAREAIAKAEGRSE